MKRKYAGSICIFLLSCMIFSACGGAGSDSLSSDPQSSAEQVSEAMLMYREAQDAGYEGSYLDFLREYLNPEEDADDSKEEPQLNDNYGADLAALSVVSIRSTFTIRAVNNYGTSTYSGAGVIYSLDETSGDAYILTNYHVIYNRQSIGNEAVLHVSDHISVWLYGGETTKGEMQAKFVGGAIDYDVAVLFIDGELSVNGHTNAAVFAQSAARQIDIGNSDKVSIGDKIFAIGNPDSNGISVTAGVVSVEKEYINVEAINGVGRSNRMLEIRIDAAVNHGNSGGGLFNEYGEYIGTVNARSEESGIRAFGYAIPANLSTAIAANAIDSASGGVRVAELGFIVNTDNSYSLYDSESGTTKVQERLIISGLTDSGALKNGDILVAYTLNGVTVDLARECQITFLRFILRSGDRVTYHVLRGGQEISVERSYGLSDFNEMD